MQAGRLGRPMLVMLAGAVALSRAGTNDARDARRSGGLAGAADARDARRSGGISIIITS